jgi:hypothetical protein
VSRLDIGPQCLLPYTILLTIVDIVALGHVPTAPVSSLSGGKLATAKTNIDRYRAIPNRSVAERQRASVEQLLAELVPATSSRSP